jgi:hypothetical protein
MNVAIFLLDVIMTKFLKKMNWKKNFMLILITIVHSYNKKKNYRARWSNNLKRSYELSKMIEMWGLEILRELTKGL